MVDTANTGPLAAQLRATLDKIPAYTWYANPTGGLSFVNTRCADYLGLPPDHPLRFGIDTGAAWDSQIALLHPDPDGAAKQLMAAGAARVLTIQPSEGLVVESEY